MLAAQADPGARAVDGERLRQRRDEKVTPRRCPRYSSSGYFAPERRRTWGSGTLLARSTERSTLSSEWREIMKTLTMTALAGALLVVATSALAARDEFLIRQIDQTIAAKRAAQVELAKQQQQTGMAGPVGEPGKPGPTSEERKASRAGRRFAGDHP